MIEIHGITESAFQSDLIDLFPGVEQFFTGMFQSQFHQIPGRRNGAVLFPFPIECPARESVFFQKKLQVDMLAVMDLKIVRDQKNTFIRNISSPGTGTQSGGQ